MQPARNRSVPLASVGHGKANRNRWQEQDQARHPLQRVEEAQAAGLRTEPAREELRPRDEDVEVKNLGAVAFFGFLGVCAIAGAWKEVQEKRIESEKKPRLVIVCVASDDPKDTPLRRYLGYDDPSPTAPPYVECLKLPPDFPVDTEERVKRAKEILHQRTEFLHR